MGRRGPKPVPTATLKSRGSRRVRERSDEPVPPSGKPRRPAWLTPKARRVWDRLCPKLYSMGVVKSIDAEVLARYCATFVFWREAHDEVKAHGLFVPTWKIINLEDGSSEPVEVGRVANPALAQIAKLAPQLDKMAAVLGLTPADRPNLKAAVPSDALKVRAEGAAAGSRARRSDFFRKKR